MNFTVYRSSAGSGKTYTLVREYLLIALSDDAEQPTKFREILAVTFTNKAAAEMKERVVSYLEKLSHLQHEQPDPLAGFIMNELKIDRLTLVSRAKAVLKAILHNYSDFAIGTIDAFVQRIVRAFSNDLQLPLNFEIETDEKRMIREAVDVLISRIGENGELTELLLRFSESQADEERSWQLEKDIREVSKHLMREDPSNALDAIKELKSADFLLIRKKLYEANNSFESRIVTPARAIKQKFDQLGVSLLDLFKGPSGIGNRLSKYADEDFYKLDDFGKFVESFREASKPFAGGAAKEKQSLIQSIAPDVIAAGEVIQKAIEEGLENYVIRTQVLQNLFAMSVLREVELILDEFRDNDHIVHISVFNKLISDVVLREPVPFIFERLGERFKHYLIDEFQDTSSVQWQNFLPLIDNGLANGKFSMLVGDGKQAIYRWRGGDVQQFASLPYLAKQSENELVNERVQSLVRNFGEEKLGMNFRSKTEIVRFNNSLFEFAATHLEEKHRFIYKEVVQEVRKGNEGGYVQFLQLKGETTGESETVRLVKQALDSGWEPADIIVIARKNDEVNVLATTLLASDIPVLATESLFLRNSPEVNFLLSLLRAIDDPEDILASTSAIHYLCRSGMIKQDLHITLTEFQQSKHSLIEWLKDAGYDVHSRNIPSKNIYHRAEDLVDLFGLKERADAFVLFFLDEVLAFANMRNSRLDFFEWWDDRSKKASVIVPEGMNAVSVMTIHKSKGLEFPVVIIPYAKWKINPKIDDLWVDYDDVLAPSLKKVLIQPVAALDFTRLGHVRSEERSKRRLDMLNELYVALTRAVSELHIILPVEKEKAVRKYESVEDFILGYLSSIGRSFEDSRISFGQPGANNSSKKTKSHKITLKIIPGAKWEDRLMLKAASKDIWSEEKEKAKHQGNLLHHLLSRISNAGEIEDVLTTAIDEGSMSEQDRQALSQQLNSIINDPSIADCFAKRNIVHREKELLLKNGKTLRPDLVVETGNELIVLDYKTGKKEERYRKQLDLYAETLHEMGYRNIRKKIYYTGTAEVDSW